MEPDIQELARTTIWPASVWSDAWIALRDNEWDEVRREDILAAAVKLSPYLRPDVAVLKLIELSRS